MPSVTMNGMTRRPVMSTPLATPHNAAATIPPSAAMPGPASALNRTAITTVVSATTEPTDKSMPADTITIVMPSAVVQTIAVCRAMSSRLAPLKKRGPISEPKMMETNSKPMSGPAVSNSRRALTRRAPRRSRPSSAGARSAPPPRVLVRGGRDASRRSDRRGRGAPAGNC